MHYHRTKKVSGDLQVLGRIYKALLRRVLVGSGLFWGPGPLELLSIRTGTPGRAIGKMHPWTDLL